MAAASCRKERESRRTVAMRDSRARARPDARRLPFVHCARVSAAVETLASMSRAGVSCVRAEMPASVQRSSQQVRRASCWPLLGFAQSTTPRPRRRSAADSVNPLGLGEYSAERLACRGHLSGRDQSVHGSDLSTEGSGRSIPNGVGTMGDAQWHVLECRTRLRPEDWASAIGTPQRWSSRHETAR